MANNFGTFTGYLKKPSGDKVQFVAPTKNPNVTLLNGTFEAGTSKVFVKMIGFKNDNIKISLSKDEKIEVPWDRRFDEDILKKVPSWQKTRIKIGDENKEFLSDWDAINYLGEHYDDYKDKKISVSIKWDKNVYQNDAKDQFTIQGMYPASDDAKPALRMRTVFYWNKDSVDDTDWESDKILRINGYIKSYDRDEKKDLFFPQTLTLNCSKLDFNNEHQKALADYRLKYLKTKSATFQECKLDCVFVIGAEKKDDDDFDESMLTDVQKEQLAMGVKSLDDFKRELSGGSFYGDFKTELRLVEFDFAGDYANGPVDTGLSLEELEENMWVGAQYDPDDDFVDINGAATKDIDDLFV